MESELVLSCTSTLPGRAPGVDQCVKGEHEDHTHECYITRETRGQFVGLKVSWIDPLPEPEEE